MFTQVRRIRDRGGGTKREENLRSIVEHPENPHSQPPPVKKLRVGGAEREARAWSGRRIQSGGAFYEQSPFLC